MRNVTLRIAVAAAALAAAAPAAATNGMRMIGFSPVQNSMGGASVAAPLDAATVVTNPAGMGAVGNRVDASVTLFMPSVSYDALWTPDGTNVFSSSKDSDRPPDFIPTLAATYRLGDRLSVGLAALGTTGMGVDYGTGLYGSATLTSYLNMRVAPAVSYKLTDRLSVGVAANLMYARMEYDVGEAMQMQPRDASGSFGYGATVGISYRAPEGATLGIAYETKSEFQDFEWDIPAHNLVVGFDGTGAPIIAAIPGGTEKLAFDQPDVLTIGAAFRPMASLLVAVDAQWIHWTLTNGKGLPEFTTDPNLTGARRWNMDWSDQVVLKLGVQYDATKELKVRAGYNWGESPLNAGRAFENVAFPAMAEHHLALGAGYDIGALTVNAGVYYSPEVKTSGSNAAEQGIIAYETKMSQLAFDLGASWKF